jgi:N-acetylglucosamine-6-phosphate deacetylase
MKKTVVGRLAGSNAVYEFGFDGVIQSADELISPPRECDGIAPGLVDVQVNGFAGVDYNDPQESFADIAQSLRTMFSTGVTRCLPTIITGSRERITGALQNMTRAKREFESNGQPEGASIEGFHVEGPHISPEDGPRGAHPREHVRPPDIEEFYRWQEAADGLVRLVTVSPEWPQTPEYIRGITRAGVVASIGHTKATKDQIQAAVDAGATMSTHLGNGAHSVLPKTANYIWDQLAEDRLTPSFIVDGIHIPGSFLHAALRAKGIQHSVLVTDAVMPALCKPGFYCLGSVEVELKEDNRVVLRGGDRLAGSALRMDVAIGKTVRLGNVTLRDALTMATVNPARVCRIAGRHRGLQPGGKADFVRFRWSETDHTFTVLETIVNGVSVYTNEHINSPIAT